MSRDATHWANTGQHVDRAQPIGSSESAVKTIHIAGPHSIAATAAETILRELPEWFGIESALRAYASEAAVLPNFTADLDGVMLGFLSMREHNAVTMEINCIAVSPAWHRNGVGARLCTAAEAWWSGRGGRLLQVKTVGPARHSTAYEHTRRFYEALGFLPVEEFADLWPGNPCLLLVKPLLVRAP